MFQVSVFIVINDFHSFSSSSAFDMMPIPYLFVGHLFLSIVLVGTFLSLTSQLIVAFTGTCTNLGLVLILIDCAFLGLLIYLNFFFFLFLCARRAFLHQWGPVSSSKLIATSGACCRGFFSLSFFLVARHFRSSLLLSPLFLLFFFSHSSLPCPFVHSWRRQRLSLTEFSGHLMIPEGR